jgi:hypothetical protein
MLYFALPQIGVRLDVFTVAWLSVTIWGGAFNTENFRAGFEAVPPKTGPAGPVFACAGEDLNLHGPKATRPSTLRVYQFRHQRAARSVAQVRVTT